MLLAVPGMCVPLRAGQLISTQEWLNACSLLRARLECALASSTLLWASLSPVRWPARSDKYVRPYTPQDPVRGELILSCISWLVLTSDLSV